MSRTEGIEKSFRIQKEELKFLLAIVLEGSTDLFLLAFFDTTELFLS